MIVCYLQAYNSDYARNTHLTIPSTPWFINKAMNAVI